MRGVEVCVCVCVGGGVQNILLTQLKPFQIGAGVTWYRISTRAVQLRCTARVLYMLLRRPKKLCQFSKIKTQISRERYILEKISNFNFCIITLSTFLPN